jgi:uncharacterized protein (TIGR03435 family)
MSPFTIKRHDPTDLTAAVTVRSDGTFQLHGINLRGLVFMAHVSNSIVTPGQIVDGPSWLDSEMFDVATKVDGEVVGPNGYTARTISLLQSLVADQFKVTLRAGTRELSVNELVVATSGGRLGPSLKPSGGGAHGAVGGGVGLMEAGQRVDLGDPDPTRGVGWQRAVTIHDGVATIDVRAKGVTMFETALHLALSPLAGPVIDRTGLAGRFDISSLRYAQTDTRTIPSDRHAFTDSHTRGAVRADAAADHAALSKALTDHLGLALRQTKVTLDVLAVESATRPH